MAQELYTRTNQKLYFAGLSLQSMQRAEAGTADNRQAIVQAEREATLFHLYGALLGLCHEVAGYYHLPLSDAICVTEILKQSGTPNPELSELMLLQKDQNSWLSGLLRAYEDLFRPFPAQKDRTSSLTHEALIISVDITDAISVITGETFENWRNALKELAWRFRQLMVES